jgi:hypothetical protein
MRELENVFGGGFERSPAPGELTDIAGMNEDVSVRDVRSLGMRVGNADKPRPALAGMRWWIRAGVRDIDSSSTRL